MLMFIESPAFRGFCEHALAVLADSAAKGVLLLALALLVALGLRRSSAAARHLVWALALGGLLLLPALSLVMPQWQLPILPRTALLSRPAPAPAAQPLPAGNSLAEPEALAPMAPGLAESRQLKTPGFNAPDHGRGAHATPRRPDVPLPLGFWLAALWLVVAAALLVPLLAGFLFIGRLIRRAEPLEHEPWPALVQALTEKLDLKRRVRVLRTKGATMPMAVGVWRPTVLLPADAEAWNEEKRQAVLLHELAHIRRGDCLTHILTRLACVAHWFNPLAWVALRKLQNERERACDDLVLAAGARPAAYAEELLDIARTMHAAATASAAAIPMARKSQLEGRLLAILDHTRNRRALTRRITWSGLLLLAVLMLPLAATKLVASQEAQHQQIPPSETTHPVLEAKRTRKHSATLAEFKPLWHDAEGRDQFLSNGFFGFEYRGSLEKLITSLDDLQFNGEHLIHRLKAVEATPPDLARLVVEVRWIAPASMELEDRIRTLAESLGFKVEKIVWDNSALQRAENDVTVSISDVTTTTQASPASTGAPGAAGEQTLHFPADRSLGWISLRDRGAKEGADWKQLGEARGEVTIPAGKEVYLKVEAGGVDLSSLLKLEPDAIREIYLEYPTFKDQDLQFLTGLTGLRELGISGGNPIQGAFTGAGLAYLKSLNRLEDLSIVFTDLNDAGLANLRLLPNLKSLTLWNDERITGAGLAPLKDLKSLKSLSFFQTPVGDRGMQSIKDMKWLESLGLEYADVTRAGVAAIAGLSGLKSLALYAKVPGAALEPLKGLSHLEDLCLADIDMNDEDLAALAGFLSLKRLDLRMRSLTGEGLKHLRALHGLEEVTLFLPKATDASIKGIAGLNVKALNLDRSSVGDEGLAYLKGMKSLDELFLSDTKITDAGLKNLADLSSLRCLRMERTRITDQGMQTLKGLDKLGDLWISGTQTGDGTFAMLGGFRQLAQLVANKTQVTDAGIKSLKGHPRLETLDLDQTSVTDRMIQYVTDMPMLQTLGMRNTGLTDAGLRELTQARRLRLVSVDNTDVTAEGIAQFKALRPECTVDGADLINKTPARIAAAGNAGADLSAAVGSGGRLAPGERVLHFPAGTTLGKMLLRDKRVSADDWQTRWTEWEDAKGDVRIPAGVDVGLRIGDEGAKDLVLQPQLT